MKATPPCSPPSIEGGVIRGITTRSPEETLQWGIEFARRLKTGDVVALCGELGAGKTVLAQGICRELGYAGEVLSPSFVRMHRYESTVGQTFLSDGTDRNKFFDKTDRNVCPTACFDRTDRNVCPTIYHADFYLMKSPEDAADLGLDELYGGDGIVLVEWAQRFPEMLPVGCWWIEIEWPKEDENVRMIKVRKEEREKGRKSFYP